MNQNKKKVYLSNNTLEAIGHRSLSIFVNQSAPRLVAAGKKLKIYPAEIEFYKANYKKFKTPKYPDQADLISRFAEISGRGICEAVIVLDRVERENYQE